MTRFSAAILTALLFAGILTLWVPNRWAVSGFQASVFALAIAWAVRFALSPFQLNTSILIIPLSGALFWGLAQLVTGETVYRWETWMAVITWGTNLVLFVLALQIFPQPAVRERFLQTVLYFSAALAVIAPIQMFTSEGRVFWLFPTEYKELLLGPFVYHNQYAGFIEIIMPLALVGAFEDRRKTLAYAAITAALCASVVAAASRAGTIIIAAEVVAICLLKLRRSAYPLRHRVLTLTLLSALLLLFTAVVGGRVLWDRFFLPDPYSVRREFLLSSLSMIRDRPWMGFGLGTWSTAYPAYALRDNGLFANQAHNDWAQWTVEGGLPFLFFIGWIAFHGIRHVRRPLWGIGVIAVFVHSLVDYPLQRPVLSGFFFVFLGVVESARISDKNSA